jgi:hypothetical protein
MLKLIEIIIEGRPGLAIQYYQVAYGSSASDNTFNNYIKILSFALSFVSVVSTTLGMDITLDGSKARRKSTGHFFGLETPHLIPRHFLKLHAFPKLETTGKLDTQKLISIASEKLPLISSTSNGADGESSLTVANCINRTCLLPNNRPKSRYLPPKPNLSRPWRRLCQINKLLEQDKESAQQRW